MIADNRLPLVSDSIFQISNWRDCLSTAGKKIDQDIQIICPFGFEILKDRSFLKKEIRRFYLLMKLPVKKASEIEVISQIYLQALLSEINEQDHIFYKTIVLLRYNRKVTIHLRGSDYKCNNSDRSINLLVRITDLDILEEYARYLIASIFATGQRTLGEIEYFYKDTRTRRRLLQIYLISKKLIKELIHFHQQDDSNIYKMFRLYNHEFEDFYTGAVNSKPTESEISILENEIIPTMIEYSKFLEKVEFNDSLFSYEIEDMYTPKNLQVKISLHKFNILKNHIITTYKTYDYCES